MASSSHDQLHVRCPFCSKRLKAAKTSAAARGRCPRCNNLFPLPTAGDRSPLTSNVTDVGIGPFLFGLSTVADIQETWPGAKVELSEYNGTPILKYPGCTLYFHKCAGQHFLTIVRLATPWQGSTREGLRLGGSASLLEGVLNELEARHGKVFISTRSPELRDGETWDRCSDIAGVGLCFVSKLLDAALNSAGRLGDNDTCHVDTTYGFRRTRPSRTPPWADVPIDDITIQVADDHFREPRWISEAAVTATVNPLDLVELGSLPDYEAPVAEKMRYRIIEAMKNASLEAGTEFEMEKGAREFAKLGGLFVGSLEEVVAKVVAQLQVLTVHYPFEIGRWPDYEWQSSKLNAFCVRIQGERDNETLAAGYIARLRDGRFAAFGFGLQ